MSGDDMSGLKEPFVPDCPQCAAWYAEAQRALYLLGSLAEDRFPDQPSFDAWMQAQSKIVSRAPLPETPREP